ncbi:MAG TPA: SdrD B-like domain-containing protein [Pyrinomonadaceae bacterium]|nr:SdrD B-like domain-containing protein [Pyrinomonadaceae bacterium]
MFNSARPRPFVVALMAALLSVLTASAAVGAAFDVAGAGTLISNHAEATYLDDDGASFATASPTITITVLAVAGLTVTPDETQPSATVAPNERVARLLRVCNTGNTPDLYTIVAADASAPATLHALFFDTDASGTLTDADRPVNVGVSMTPRLARGQCAGVLAVVDTNAGEQGAHLNITLRARSNVLGAVGGVTEDSGTVINLYGTGARLTAPEDPRLPPVKLVEGRERVTAAPGQTLNYTISFRNSGDITARNVLLSDELPEGLEYVTGSLRLGNRILTDAEDADEGRAAGRRVELRLAQVAAGGLVQLSLQARVNSRVAPGAGVVNTASVAAENAPSVSSSSATAVVNPFGLVYEGRSGGGATIANARVALLSDPTTAALVALTPDAGSLPNDANANPFQSDPQGRWSFALAAAQLGATDLPARYFLGVTAEGYRGRMLEVTVKPAGDASIGLFSMNVRALDGQPIARAGGFELTEDAVSVENLAAFALNVPLFETSALEVSKVADRPSAEIGDVVTYRVEIHNATSATVDEVTVRDQLPPSFHYAEGTARVENPPAPTRSIEPESNAEGQLIFRLGRIAAGARAVVTYRVRIGANAREGEQVNSAVAAGRFTNGEPISAAAARASVRVRRGLFSTQQVIVGRVFDDANANGQFDDGDRAVEGVRLYLNNGQSVVTDSAGQYNFPSVGDGAQVIALDPVTLPPGYRLADSDRRDAQSWTRLLRTPLGGGALLRQNFALRSTGAHEAASAAGLTPARDAATRTNLTDTNLDAQGRALPLAASGGEARRPSEKKSVAQPLASGTYEMAAVETLEPVAPGEVRVLSPSADAFVQGAALEVVARVNAAWTVELEVAGERVADSKIGERRIDHKNGVATFTFVGINVQPGPNRIKVTAISPEGARGRSTELSAYGRGPAKRLEIVADKNELSAGGRDQTRLRVRAFDQWGHPAADAPVAVEVSAGRLLREQTGEPAATTAQTTMPTDASGASQQLVTLSGGEGILQLVADNAPGAARVRATTGTLEAQAEVRITPEIRPTIMVGLAEVSVGNAPELALHDMEGDARSRLAFFYRGRLWRGSLLTLAYDSSRPLNRTAGGDRLFQLDPLERAYPLFGDSSTRYEDAQSNSKLYARLDYGRSYLMFGDFETENRDLALAGYSRKLTGVKLHAENSKGDFISVTGARPDTAFARDVFPGGAAGLLRLSHAEVMPGSETVFIEVRDRRNPEIILSREALIRSVDYNLDAASGDLFFLRTITSFDFALNLVQVVVTYEHRTTGMSSAVYTGRAVKNFESIGLRLGLSFVNQRQDELGSYVVAGLDGEKRLPRGGRVTFEWATSRGRVASGGNLFGAEADERHDGNAYRVQLEQPIGYREGVLRASYARADEGFLNPFGATVTPGSRRAEMSFELKPRRSSTLRFGLLNERNHTSNVDNERTTGSVLWTENIGERLRINLGYDFRRLNDAANDHETNSNLLTVGAELQATDKLQLSVKREQNLGEADPTYPDQTTLAANYQWNRFTRLFFTQRLASAPIVPISDAGATGFASTGARRETAIGIETRLGRYANLVSRYQIENGANGTDSFAVIGLSNRWALTKELSLDLAYERGIHLAGEGESFNSMSFGFGWQPTDNFRSNARYELRDRGGMGSILTFGAAGRLADNLTTLGRVQLSRAGFGGRDTSSLSATAALAWRPLHTDRAGLLFSYTRRDLTQETTTGTGGALSGLTHDRSDSLSSDMYLQATRDLELYGRFALKFSDAGTPELAPVSTLTYMAQGRAAYRFARYLDAAGELRLLDQPSSRTRRTSFGTELGFWVLPDLRVGGGYNWTGASEPSGGLIVGGRRGFYFNISSKLSNLFDLFGASRATAQESGESGDAGREKTESGGAKP